MFFDKDHIEIPCPNCAANIIIPVKDLEGSNDKKRFLRINSKPQKCLLCGTKVSVSSSDIVVNIL
jgi:hypothetical protein